MVRGKYNERFGQPKTEKIKIALDFVLTTKWATLIKNAQK